MDKFKNTINEFLKFLVISFATTSLFWVIRAKLFNIELIPVMDFIYIFGLCVISALLERIFLSPKILKKLSYTKRNFILMFFICVIILIFALKAHFFQPSLQGIAIRFIIAYTLGCTISIIIDKFLTKEGEKYTEILNEYKMKNKKS